MPVNFFVHFGIYQWKPSLSRVKQSENSRRYFSEKIINPLLCNTVPIYLGCVNIKKYFPNNTISTITSTITPIITLTGNLLVDIKLLKLICSNPDKFLKKIDIEKVKDKINLVKHIKEIFT